MSKYVDRNDKKFFIYAKNSLEEVLEEVELINQSHRGCKHSKGWVLFSRASILFGNTHLLLVALSD